MLVEMLLELVGIFCFATKDIVFHYALFRAIQVSLLSGIPPKNMPLPNINKKFAIKSACFMMDWTNPTKDNEYENNHHPSFPFFPFGSGTAFYQLRILSRIGHG